MNTLRQKFSEVLRRLHIERPDGVTTEQLIEVDERFIRDLQKEFGQDPAQLEADPGLAILRWWATTPLTAMKITLKDDQIYLDWLREQINTLIKAETITDEGIHRLYNRYVAIIEDVRQA